MVDLDRLRLWIEALRDGGYRQGRGALKERPRLNSEEYEYCCLGVLCELAIKQGVPVTTKVNDWVVEFDGYTQTLPPSVADWLGADDEQLRVYGPGGPVTPIVANDARSWTFEQIADGLERFAEHLRKERGQDSYAE